MEASKTGHPECTPSTGRLDTAVLRGQLPCTCPTWAPPSPLLWLHPALHSLRPRRWHPSTLLFGPAGIDFLMGRGVEVLDHMKLQGHVWNSVTWSRLEISVKNINGYFLQHSKSISVDILPRDTKWALYLVAYCNTDYDNFMKTI